MPDLGPGDEAMIVSPVGSPPFPQGPVTVLQCIYHEGDPWYIIEHEDGRQEQIDAIELWRFEDWVQWMKENAN